MKYQEEIETILPNPQGIPSHNENSESLRKEHNRWKNAVDKRKRNRKNSTTYWKRKSGTVAL